jgi:AcrR family transcriptional regulator
VSGLAQKDKSGAGGLLGRLGMPTQRRAKRTRQTILEAARERFNEAGFDRTPIKEIAQAAGVSVGAIYEHFKDKKTLLREVGHLEARRLKHEAFVPFREALAETNEGDATRLDLEQLIRLAIKGTLESHRRYPRLLSELVDIANRDQEFFAFVQEVTEEAVTFVERLLVIFAARPPGPNSKRSARLLVLICESAVRKFTLYGDMLSEAELVDELTTLVMRYLYPDKAAIGV